MISPPPPVGAYTYHGQFDGAAVLPHTNTNWSVANVNDAEFGVKVVDAPLTVTDGLYMAQFVVEVLTAGLPGGRRPWAQWLHGY